MAVPKGSKLIRLVLTDKELKAISKSILTEDDIKHGGESWAIKKYLFEKSDLGVPLTSKEKNRENLKNKRMQEKVLKDS